MKDKKILIALIVIVLLAIGGGAYAFLTRNAGETDEEDYGELEEQLPALKPEEVGLEMEALKGNQQVVFTLTKPDGITAVEYELTYFAQDGQQRAVIGTVEMEEGEEVIASKPLDLGSCSSGVCKYDTGVEKVDLLLKVTKDSKDYQVKDSLEL